MQSTDSSSANLVDLPQTADKLLTDSHALTNRIVPLIWEQISGYDPPHLASEELTDRVHQTVSAVIRAIASTDVDVEASRRAYELGVRRARQGLPVESILFSYRNAERVLTGAFGVEAKRLRAGDAQEGMRRMLRALDELAAASIEGYHSTESELTAQRDSLSTDLISGLTYGELGSNRILSLSASLGCEPSGPYMAIALSMGSASGLTATVSVQRELVAALASAISGRMVIGTAREAKVLLVPAALEDPDVERIAEVLRRHSEVRPRIGVGEPVGDITRGGVTCRQALRSLAVTRMTDRPLVRYRDLLPEVVTSMIDQDLQAWLVERCQRPLGGRTPLQETVTAFVDGNMSVQRAADALSVHPNTVHYRLKRIRELTGMDPRSTTDLFTLLLASRLPPIEEA